MKQDLLNWIETKIGAVTPADTNLVLEIVGFLEKFARYHGHDGPISLQQKSFNNGREIVRCPYCLTTPVGERLWTCVHHDSKRFTDVYTKIQSRKKMDPKIWLDQHMNACHFHTPTKDDKRLKFQNYQDYAKFAIQYALCRSLFKKLLIPSNLPTSEVIEYLKVVKNLLASNDNDKYDPNDVEELELKIDFMLAEMVDGPFTDDGTCFVCHRKQGHDGRFCNAESRSKVAILRNSKAFPNNYKCIHSYRHYKQSCTLSGVGGQKLLQSHAENQKKMVVIVALSRMLVNLLSLGPISPPVGDSRLWWLAMQVVAGWVNKVTNIRFQNVETIVDNDNLQDLVTDQDWKIWRDKLVDLFEEHILPHLPSDFNLLNTTKIPLKTHAEDCATNVGTKLRANLEKLVYRLLATRLRVLKERLPILKEKGVFSDVLKVLKKHVGKGQVIFTPPDDKTSSWASLVDPLSGILEEVIGDCLHHVPLGRLIILDKKSGPSRPALAWERWKEQVGNKDLTEYDFSLLDENTKSYFQQGVQHDFVLWTIVCTEAAMDIPWIVPNYSYYTSTQRQNWIKNGKFAKFYPKHQVNDSDEPTVEWVDEAFDVVDANTVTDVQAIIDHVIHGGKGMPGVTSTMLFEVYKRICSRLESYNDSLPPSDAPKPQDPHDPLSVQPFLDLPHSLTVDKNSKQYISRKEKEERFKKFGFQMPHQPVPYELRSSRLHDMNWILDEDIDSMLVDEKDVAEEVKNKEENKSKPVKIPVPVLAPSFSPIHFYFDWDSCREFYQLYFGINLPIERNFSLIMDTRSLPFLNVGKRKRSSVRGPEHSTSNLKSNGVTNILGFKTDGISLVWLVQHYSLVPVVSIDSSPIHLDLQSEASRNQLQGMIQDPLIQKSSADPGRRDIVKIWNQMSIQDCMKFIENGVFGRRDKCVVIKKENGQVVIYKLHYNAKKKYTVYEFDQNLKSSITCEQNSWESRLVPGTGALIRDLGLDAYYRMCGYTKHQKDLSKASKEKNSSGISYKAITSSLPSLRTFNLQKSLFGIVCRLKQMMAMLKFNYLDFDPRSYQIRKFFRRKQVLESVAADLTKHPTLDGGKMLLFHGSARFNSSSGGLKASPNLSLTSWLRKKSIFVLVGEYHSSKICCNCRKQVLSLASYSTLNDLKELVRKKLPWGVKFCPSCGLHLNRDWNGCINILYVGIYQVFHDGKRPHNFYKSTS